MRMKADPIHWTYHPNEHILMLIFKVKRKKWDNKRTNGEKLNMNAIVSASGLACALARVRLL